MPLTSSDVRPCMLAHITWLVAWMVTVVFEGSTCGAVKSPAAEMVPSVELPPVTPFTLQFTAVFEVLVTVAVNCCVADRFTVALDGDTTMLVSVWFTVTFTMLVTVRPPASSAAAVAPAAAAFAGPFDVALGLKPDHVSLWMGLAESCVAARVRPSS